MIPGFEHVLPCVQTAVLAHVLCLAQCTPPPAALQVRKLYYELALALTPDDAEVVAAAEAELRRGGAGGG